MKPAAVLAATILAVGFLYGCAPMPVIDTEHEAVRRDDSKTLSLADMERVIRLAAYDEQWLLHAAGPGHFTATKHADDDSWTETVNISYTATDFSIEYAGSTGMHFKRENRTIDRHGQGIMNDLQSTIEDEVQQVIPGG